MNGCCAGPMQIHNGYGSGAGTWGRFKVDGDADGRTDIYDPDDAIATAAAYLRASGAPRDWRAAIFAYNHSGAYVEPSPLPRGRVPPGRGECTGDRGARRIGRWPCAAAGLPWRAMRRPNRRRTSSSWRGPTASAVTDCFGGPPHELAGEHPLGLAVDVVPVDGDWNRTRDPGDALRLEPSVCASRLCRSGPVPGDPLQRLSGPRRSGSQHVAASAPVLAARARRAVYARSVGACPRSEVEAMTAPSLRRRLVEINVGLRLRRKGAAHVERPRRCPRLPHLPCARA